MNKIYRDRGFAHFALECPPHWKLAQEAPAPVALFFFVIRFKNFPAPEARLLGPVVEICRLVEHGVIVIAQDAPLALINYQIKTFLGIWPVADHVAQAVNSLYASFLDIRQDRTQGLNIRMYIAYDRKHTRPLLNKNNSFNTGDHLIAEMQWKSQNIYQLFSRRASDFNRGGNLFALPAAAVIMPRYGR
jgi:hypothetical protein